MYIIAYTQELSGIYFSVYLNIAYININYLNTYTQH